LLTRAGIKTSVASDVSAVLWSKLIINAAIGPVSALSGLPNGQLPKRKKWRTLLERAAREGAAVAARQGIRLLYRNPVRAVAEVCRNTAENLSSMLQDVRRQRKTEIDAINGAIVRAAAAAGLPAPVHTDLIRRIRTLRPGRSPAKP
jgi:2-dehydropantoate 2-reductase